MPTSCNICFHLVRFNFNDAPFEAHSQFENFHDMVHTCDGLIRAALTYTQKKFSLDMVDECVDLLTSLVKLDLIFLHDNENVTSVFVKHTLRRSFA